MHNIENQNKMPKKLFLTVEKFKIGLLRKC